MLWRRANKMQSSWNEHKNHMPIALQSKWVSLPTSFHLLSFSLFPQPTPYWWWLYVMFVPEKICMWKAFPLAAWGPAKLAIKWLKKGKKNKCKTLKWNWNRLKWNQIANESQLCLPFIVRGYSNIANVLRRRRLSAAHKSFNSNWFVNI